MFWFFTMFFTHHFFTINCDMKAWCQVKCKTKPIITAFQSALLERATQGTSVSGRSKIDLCNEICQNKLKLDDSMECIKMVRGKSQKKHQWWVWSVCIVTVSWKNNQRQWFWWIRWQLHWRVCRFADLVLAAMGGVSWLGHGWGGVDGGRKGVFCPNLYSPLCTNSSMNRNIWMDILKMTTDILKMTLSLQHIKNDFE